jgi:hypothetical protein
MRVTLISRAVQREGAVMTKILDILNSAAVGLRVVARLDIGGVEVQVREGDNVPQILVLSPMQAIALPQDEPDGDGGVIPGVLASDRR